ncbi:hypothetical protein BAUCODRAFT_195746 [Baudoinia panamericana UAMH 10762]|uniref:Uncharacterized protein n=1 Tax=Baudoinia panamericana (strain UAMH 10762) TaxID=717646 RepID=M2NNK2_BAUPA|nr:uncharacterized protein BAUCODRAFT_195746 [Baudoinia panamericana UAMH 10762]EMD01085.1 hypothetical protein BAUCODRAFT_195746 [Baudoinia panamericana UAMH 10762]
MLLLMLTRSGSRAVTAYWYHIVHCELSLSVTQNVSIHRWLTPLCVRDSLCLLPSIRGHRDTQLSMTALSEPKQQVLTKALFEEMMPTDSCAIEDYFADVQHEGGNCSSLVKMLPNSGVAQSIELLPQGHTLLTIAVELRLHIVRLALEAEKRDYWAYAVAQDEIEEESEAGHQWHYIKGIHKPYLGAVTISQDRVYLSAHPLLSVCRKLRTEVSPTYTRSRMAQVKSLSIMHHALHRMPELALWLRHLHIGVLPETYNKSSQQVDLKLPRLQTRMRWIRQALSIGILHRLPRVEHVIINIGPCHWKLDVDLRIKQVMGRIEATNHPRLEVVEIRMMATGVHVRSVVLAMHYQPTDNGRWQLQEFRELRSDDWDDEERPTCVNADVEKSAPSRFYKWWQYLGLLWRRMTVWICFRNG